MRPFALHLHDSQGAERFDDVVQLIAADGSGSFGILGGHAPLVAVLRYGLARFVDVSGTWRYLAVPGGVLSARDDCVKLATVRYFLGTDRSAIDQRLEQEMARSDSDVHASRATLIEIQHALVRRLGELSGGIQQGLGE
jgi:F-type H+-transporting ATPase subunit epsilon